MTVEARRHHLEQVNGVLRRPGMYSRDDAAEQLLLEAMAAVDGELPRWRAERDRMNERWPHTSTGAMGAYAGILPANATRDAVASAYAEVAHRLGWLAPDRTLTAAEYRRMTADIGAWVAADRTLTEVIETFGPPSVRIGGTGRRWPKSLVYATADPADDLICVHVWNDLEAAHPEPVVLAVRHRPGPFPDAFSFTPEGRRRRPRSARPAVWIFHGDGASHASGVFGTRAAGLAWAAEHGVTGLLSEYPFGGTYDVALAEGRFTPSKPHHCTTAHIVAFGPGLDHVHVTDGRP